MTPLLLTIEGLQKLLMMTLLELLTRNALPVGYKCLCDVFEWSFTLVRDRLLSVRLEDIAVCSVVKAELFVFILSNRLLK
jgi:hypothetical protein